MTDKEEIDRRGIILASLGCLGLVGALATLGVVTDGGGTTDDTLTESELVDAGSSTFDATAGMMSTVKSRMTDIDGQDPTALLTRRPGEIEVESSVGIDGTDLATGGDDE